MESSKKSDTSLSEESVKRRTELFNKYVYPHRNLIYMACIKYSILQNEIEDNYIEVLVNFYKYIETYDPNRSLQTWLHVVAKRLIFDLNKRRMGYLISDNICVSSISQNLDNDEAISENCMGVDNYEDLYNDDILNALNKMKPIYREALILQLSGYKLTEIVEISYQNGNLRTKNIETVKSRLFLAKQQMRKMITRNGTTRKEE